MDTDKYKKRISLGTPLSMRGWPKWLIFLLSLLGLAYLTFPTLGIFELIPDYIPVVGHIDEGTATITVWYGLLEWLDTRRKRREEK